MYLISVNAQHVINKFMFSFLSAINDSKDYYKYCQKPELQTNSMEQGRSLCDPIYDVDHAAFSRRTEMWESMHREWDVCRTCIIEMVAVIFVEISLN